MQSTEHARINDSALNNCEAENMTELMTDFFFLLKMKKKENYAPIIYYDVYIQTTFFFIKANILSDKEI